jgi:adenylyltransferase/sulfurtransferase
LIDYDAFCGIAPPKAATTGSSVPEITVEELKAKYDRGEDVYLLDVRETERIPDSARIHGSKLIPLGQVADRAGELDPSRE